MGMIEFRYLQPQDAEAAADIHIEGQPGTVLTLMGRSFLVELYRAVCLSQWGEGVGAFDDGKLIGHVALAVSSSKFFSEFKWRYLWRVIIPVTFSLLRHPKVIVHIIKGWGYADQAHSPEREGDALFLGIKREYMRHSLAPELIRFSFALMDSIGVETTTFMIEKRNRAMHWMISQMNGLYVIREFEAFGRKMILYRVPIAPNLNGTKLPEGQPCTPAHNYLSQEIGGQIGSGNLIR
jgi:hypothetical protein